MRLLDAIRRLSGLSTHRRTARKLEADALTGLVPKGAFDAALQRERRRLAAEGGSSWLLIADVDALKEVNDRLGHHAGDAVLVEVARRMKSTIGERGLVARIGGDEFGILVHSGLPERGVGTVVAELERAVSRLPVVVDGISCSVGVSVGASEVNGSTDPATVIRRADESMYLAKRRAGSDPFDRVSELVVGLLDSRESGLDNALASGIAEVAQAEVAFVVHAAAEQWWPAEPSDGTAHLLRSLARQAWSADELREEGAWRLAAPLRADGAAVGGFAVSCRRPFAKPDRIALARAGVALGQALLRLREGVAVRRRISELEHLAFCDENTGLANRRALLGDLESRWSDSVSLSLLFLDFDGLRQVNNQLSYERGNTLLRSVADAIRDSLRPGELAARLHGSGGDEFIIVLPGVGAVGGAATRAAEVERRLAEIVLDPDIAPLYGGASVGYALRQSGEEPLELVERAAALMRERKRQRKQLAQPSP